MSKQKPIGVKIRPIVTWPNEIPECLRVEVSLRTPQVGALKDAVVKLLEGLGGYQAAIDYPRNGYIVISCPVKTSFFGRPVTLEF